MCPLTLKRSYHNVWVSQQIELEKFKSPFRYKYVITQNGQIKQMEKGFNRVAELDILPDTGTVLSQQSTYSSGKSSKSAISSKSNTSHREFKECTIEDEW